VFRLLCFLFEEFEKFESLMGLMGLKEGRGKLKDGLGWS